ncbi:GntR family transcriptional regulator [Lacticaseibacillus nasuensis]|uniref:Transcriptional regulator n=1 Tax=Lacticaseibacillus nasuensis JCM 17158 TaxID=1291734 RepID=A0A0R1JHC4_9LACO|nr:GntR family transcriptional regulator [Lacticaseibacillus nasuensis]KRK70536.1 Transcriptional regulator [Lacticaseibacillus nasuensis JCM 17158]
MHKPAKYVQIYNQILQMIKNGQLPAGSKLPSEEILGNEFEVSRVTLRTALSLLKEDGVIKSVHGQGHFVSPSTNTDHTGIEALRIPVAESLTVPIDDREVYYHEAIPSAYTDRLFQMENVPYYTLNIWYRHEQVNVANAFVITPPSVIDRLGINLSSEAEIVKFVEQKLYAHCANSELTITQSDRKPSSFKRQWGSKSPLMLMTENLFAVTGELLAQSKFYIPSELFRTSLMRFPTAMQTRGQS